MVFDLLSGMNRAWESRPAQRLARSARRHLDYSLENLAPNLKAALALTGDKPAILSGHSIGMA
jgi:surfactin synthase thioesterase subunit